MLSIETGSTKALIFSFYRHNPGISRQAVVRAGHSTVFSPYLSELHSQRRRRAERERGLHREKRFLIAHTWVFYWMKLCFIVLSRIDSHRVTQSIWSHRASPCLTRATTKARESGRQSFLRGRSLSGVALPLTLGHNQSLSYWTMTVRSTGTSEEAPW